MLKKGLSILLFGITAFLPVFVFAQTEFNPNLIITDEELQDTRVWTRNDLLNFLQKKNSFLSNYAAIDVSGTPKMAADIIYDAAQNYGINPKFLVVTLQKEQSLITDPSPTTKQLDWATGYGVCDSCSMNDPKLQKYRGFGAQVDNTAGLMRWYYDNNGVSFVKKKDIPIQIDNTPVTPQSWATAFLYTYTPHLHGNKNFWRLWNEWFETNYPNGSLLRVSGQEDVWLVQDGQKRRFKNLAVLVSRFDPKGIITVPEVELDNYQTGAEINFSNFSILNVSGQYYLVDYDMVRPFASSEVVGKLGYNPDEIIEAVRADIAGYKLGSTIGADVINPAGVIFEITDLNNRLYLYKNNILSPLIDSAVALTNFKNLPREKHLLSDFDKYAKSSEYLVFADGTLIQGKGENAIYVVEKGQKREIKGENAFDKLGYKQENIIRVDIPVAMLLPTGEPLSPAGWMVSAPAPASLVYVTSTIKDSFKTRLPAYLVAEYPSGKIIAGKKVDTKHSVASFTKVLTAFTAAENNFNWDATTTYNSALHRADGSTLALLTGEKLNNRDLFNATLIHSANNLARMLVTASNIKEKDFIKKMNGYLTTWGAKSSKIVEVTGLDARNISTARDFLNIFIHTLGNIEVKNSLSQVKYTFKEALSKNKTATHNLESTNLLLKQTKKNYEIIASKTGYSTEDGAVLALLVKVKESGKEYVIITLGDKYYSKRFEEPDRLANWIASEDVKISAIK